LPERRRKHIPLRKCIACQERKAKRELVRIVCTPEGTIEIDRRGKRAGRGAYVCPDPQCWEVALDPQRLARALRCQVGFEQATTLKQEMASLDISRNAGGENDGT
jgi:predicted RNA-binding protein YlxR (DUF448 family)